MPKQRTNKTIAKRFKVTSTGKIMRGHHGSRHRMSHKNKRQIRRFSEPKQVNKSFYKAIKNII
ncbi:50S ribosomal protein L35 [Candidatus Gottesmanbacteria bacterium RIFCSPHIGHO2_02_FULL_39_11]|uniref:Large ribosomal subunit protein bL35 n=1 Tax=Candidatus Gottesmanbacteria bacterium RIFCSPHIGHO2_02_FULL_39_11 TaxID=1798382 RepID=A0A1F5ZUF2_9BACT|nr:MAG: 50S ribosomal protein L35 [Candidatus Gottesmanbacteria bacterium RIFCSPHIGHO2_02_FULL_39_11]